MQSYSLRGYINALLRRTGKTLMVEGTSDKTIINRLKLERTNTTQNMTSGLIDCVQIVEDSNLSGLGNKSRINNIRCAISQLPSPNRERINAKFGTLTDREWDGISIAGGIPTTWLPPMQIDGSFITKGHSIENYFFNVDGCISYLCQSFPDEISKVFLNDLRLRFHQIIALAAVFSLNLSNLNSIGKSNGVISYKYISWNNQRYTLVDSIHNILLSRGIPISTTFKDSINTDVGIYLSAFNTEEPGRWLCHGHIGEQTIWACIANLAQEHGINNATLCEIERGSKTNKLKHSANHLCSLQTQDRTPLDDAIDWLHT